ncbi:MULTISPECIES: hypothetical protein [Burkholderiaceae]|nr:MULTISPECIES: hypothetical protein [Burkholderiaceae]
MAWHRLGDCRTSFDGLAVHFDPSFALAEFILLARGRRLPR